MNYFLLALALLLCSCQVPGVAGEIPRRPEEYSQGRADGCSSGHAAGGNYTYQWRSDYMRFGWSPAYRESWYEGYAECKANYAGADAR